MTALQLWLQNHNYRLTQEAIDEALMEYIAHIEKKLAEARKDADSKQAKIDMLMLEFCPDEMTAEQLDEWAKHQKPYEGDTP